MASDYETSVMTPGLILRLQDIPGVESVSIDLATESGGINLKIAEDSDEQLILRQVHELLVAYGVKGLVQPKVTLSSASGVTLDPGIDVRITQVGAGARIRVGVGDIQSSRQVAATPAAIAQGLADAWCQVLGRIPREVVSVSLSDTGALAVVVSDGESEHRGVADVGDGWTNALIRSVGSALELFSDEGAKPTNMAPSAW